MAWMYDIRHLEDDVVIDVRQHVIDGRDDVDALRVGRIVCRALAGGTTDTVEVRKIDA